MSQIKLQREYPYSPDLVWEALTDSAALEQWAMENDFKPIVGHKFQFREKPNRFWNGIIEGEVLEVKKPNRLVYTWRTNNAKTPTTVIWTLTSSKSGTLVVLEQSGFKGVGGFLFSKFILSEGWRKQMGSYIPIVLAHIKEKGLVFEKGKYLIADRQTKGSDTWKVK